MFEITPTVRYDLEDVEVCDESVSSFDVEDDLEFTIN